jgi:EAL domain-containing protein (putative c-di-GMP-specific phosphodiesterase class I)
MPLAEQTDLVSPITRQVLANALGQAARWHVSGHPLLLAVNGSARNLLDLQFPDHIESFLHGAGVPPESLELEITENAMLGDPTRVRVVLRALQAIGVRLAIDDFGTGFSSLVNLRDLPVDRVKIDRSFVQDLRHSRGASIVGPIIELAHNLDITAVAEGVEDLQTLTQLRELGCDYAQGFAIAAPMPAGELTDWLDEPTLILPHTSTGS